MASYGTMHRASTTQQAAASTPQPRDDESKASIQKSRFEIKIVCPECPFNIPHNQEAAAVRIIKNLASFALYYAQFVYIVLLITLIPQRKVSLVFLVATKEIAFLYLLLLRAAPNSIVLHKIIDKRFVLFLLSIIIGLEMILTRAGIHLLLTLVSTIPIILIHAALWKREDFVKEDANAAEELLPIMQNNHGDADSGVSV